MKSLLGVVTLVAAGLLLVVLLLFVGQRKMMYPAPTARLPERLPEGIEHLELSDGYGLFLNAAQQVTDRRPVLIFTHGNGETAYAWRDAFGEILDAGISVLLVEYPGYGGASGRPSLGSITRTMHAAYDAIVAREDVKPEAIIAYGRSIGGGAAAILARDRPIVALGLESSFSSMAELVRDHGFPRWLLRDRYDNLRIVQHLTIPIFVFHGRRDEIIRFDHATRLENAARDVVLDESDCGHNDCPRPWRNVVAFLRQRASIEVKAGG